MWMNPWMKDVTKRRQFLLCYVCCKTACLVLFLTKQSVWVWGGGIEKHYRETETW